MHQSPLDELHAQIEDEVRDKITELGNEYRANPGIILTETDIPYSWETEDTIYWAVRKVQPSTDGISFTSEIVDTQNFSIDASWDINNCYISVYVQEQNSKEVIQAKSIRVIDYMGIVSKTFDKKFETGNIEVNYFTKTLKVSIANINNYELNIYDIGGRSIYSSTLKDKETVIKLNNLIGRNGVYFAQIANNEGKAWAIKKFVLLK